MNTRWITVTLTLSLDHPNLDLTDFAGTVSRAIQSSGLNCNGATAQIVDGETQIAAHFEIPDQMTDAGAATFLASLIKSFSLPLTTPVEILSSKVFPAAAPPIPGK
jgi:hypothetical protein